MLLPFSDYPVGLGSIFIVDPLYTLPLVVGMAAWWRWRDRAATRGLRWVHAGLALSTLYLGWSVFAQTQVTAAVQRSLVGTPLAGQPVLVTPSPLNTLLWRVVVMDNGGYHEGFRSLFDRDAAVALERHASDDQLLTHVKDDWAVRRLEWFTKGFYAVRLAAHDVRVAASAPGTVRQLLGAVETASAATDTVYPGARPVVMTDLRMGQTSSSQSSRATASCPCRTLRYPLRVRRSVRCPGYGSASGTNVLSGTCCWSGDRPRASA
jgi:inner membrane protein